MLNYILQLEKWKIVKRKNLLSGVRKFSRQPSNLNTIKYHLTFPTNYRTNTSGFYKEEKPPLVILFGWAGGQDRHLKKYSEVYENRGMITARHFAHIKYLFWERQNLLTIGNDIINLIISNNLEQHPIFFHCFSNGGAFQYHGFSKAYEKYPSLRVKGVIFDSAPGARLLGYYRALPEMIGGNMLLRYLFASAAVPAMILKDKLQRLKSKYLKPDVINDSFEFLRQQKNICPQHFLYSKADKLVYSEDIEDFIRARNSVGVKTSFTKFDSSPHVQHMLHNKNEYVDSTCKFINDCLK